MELVKREVGNDTQRWFISPVKPPLADLQLFCLPYAGKGGAMFVPWLRALRHRVEVIPIQLAGRDSRKHERPAEAFAPLIGELAGALWPRLHRPYALFGHSMGSLLAFELCRELRRLGAPAPVYLFVSGRMAPQESVEPVAAGLDDDAFVETIQRRFGGIPDSLLRDAELLRFFLPVLRADFRLLGDYRFEDQPPLDCRIAAFGGRSDPCVSPVGLEAWARHTRAAFEVQTFEGGHFYLHDQQPHLLRAISNRLAGW